MLLFMLDRKTLIRIYSYIRGIIKVDITVTTKKLRVFVAISKLEESLLLPLIHELLSLDKKIDTKINSCFRGDLKVDITVKK
jgi:hypothetical protein